MEKEERREEILVEAEGKEEKKRIETKSPAKKRKVNIEKATRTPKRARPNHDIKKHIFQEMERGNIGAGYRQAGRQEKNGAGRNINHIRRYGKKTTIKHTPKVNNIYLKESLP